MPNSPVELAGGAGHREVVEIDVRREAPQLECTVREAVLPGGVLEIRRVDRGGEAGEVLAGPELPVLRAERYAVRRLVQRDDAHVVVAHVVDAALVRRAVEGPEVRVGPAGVVRQPAADANRELVLDDRNGDAASESVAGRAGTACLAELGLADELRLGEIGVARAEDEHAARRALAVQRALRAAQHLDPFDVEEAHWRRDAEIRHDERHVIEVIADRRIAIRVAATGAAQVVGPRGGRLPLALERTGHRGHEVLDAGDVHLLQRCAAEGLDGEGHRLQRLLAGLLCRDDDLVELRSGGPRLRRRG